MTRRVDDKQLENISGAGDGDNFDKQADIGPKSKTGKDPLLVDAPEDPIGGSGGVSQVDPSEGLGGGGGGDTFNKS